MIGTTGAPLKKYTQRKEEMVTVASNTEATDQERIEAAKRAKIKRMKAQQDKLKLPPARVESPTPQLSDLGYQSIFPTGSPREISLK